MSKLLEDLDNIFSESSKSDVSLDMAFAVHSVALSIFTVRSSLSSLETRMLVDSEVSGADLIQSPSGEDPDEESFM